MKHFSKNHIQLLLIAIFLSAGIIINIKTAQAQSALGQLEAITGQRVTNVRVPEANGPTAEERAAWAAERRDARLAARRVQGIEENKKGNTAYENKNYK